MNKTLNYFNNFFNETVKEITINDLDSEDE